VPSAVNARRQLAPVDPRGFRRAERVSGGERRCERWLYSFANINSPFAPGKKYHARLGAEESGKQVIAVARVKAIAGNFAF